MNKLYTMPNCPKCEYAKKILKNAGIEYEEVTDVQKAIDQGYTSAPVFEYEASGAYMKYPDIIKAFKGDD